MSTTVNLYGEFDSLRFECANDEPTVWIRAKREGVSLATVSLGLSFADIEALETALAAARMNLTAKAAKAAA